MHRLALVLPAVLLLPNVGAAAGLEQAQRWLQQGEYVRAEQPLRQLATANNCDAQLGLAQLLRETGRYEQAGRMARRAARAHCRARALTLAGEIALLRGELAEAERAFKQVLRRHHRQHRARALLGWLYWLQGRATAARQQFSRLYDAYDRRQISDDSAEDLTAVAMACRYTANFRDAADSFHKATEVDPRYLSAWVQWGEISLEKYQADYAIKQFRRALAVNPNYVPALTGLARAMLEHGHDVHEIRSLLTHALEVNPHSVEARIVQARLLDDEERYDEAKRRLTQALEINPRHLGTLSMLAATYFLTDHLDRYRLMKKRFLSINPRSSQLCRAVATAATQHYRYEDAVKLGHEAIAINNRDWYALAELGTNYLRLGQDKEGLKYLRRAWQGDPYNERAFNLLNLYEQVLQHYYTVIDVPPFRLRVHRDEAKLLRRVVLPVLRRAYDHYVKLYRFRPKQPITVELYRKREHYAVRTVGQPTLPVLGVCFGRVITSTSPTLGAFNWAQLLWHEMNHVFTIQLSRSRIPRWLSEGLAQWETSLRRREWRQEGDLAFYKALEAGRELRLDTINGAFARARHRIDLAVAYYQSYLTTAFLVRQVGRPKLVEALKRYGKGQSTFQIWPALTGLSLPQLAQRFAAAQRKRLKHYGAAWHVDLKRFEDLQSHREYADKHPKEAAGLAALAAAQFLREDHVLADKTAQKALRLDPHDKLALYVRANLADLQGTSITTAIHLFRRLVAAGGDGYDAQFAIGRLWWKAGRATSAIGHLEKAKAYDPQQHAPYRLLASIRLKTGDAERALVELKQLAYLDQQHYRPAFRLVEMLAQRSDFAGVREFGQLAYNIQPCSAALHLRLAQAYDAPAPLKNTKRAIWQLETALLCPSANRPLIKRQLARLRRQIGP